jgi:eukaryotic-like serine/threonine-protein kinase
LSAAGSDGSVVLGHRPAAKKSTRVGRFGVVGLLGEGHNSTVVRVRDDVVGRDAAAKLLRADSGAPTAISRFVWEARVTGQLAHPNIVPVHELSVTETGQPFFIMQRLSGETLEALVGRQSGSTLPSTDLVNMLGIIGKVCDAVSFAHHQGIVHGGLAPENVMVGRFGEVYVLDWGQSEQVGGKPRPGVGLGASPAFMAPECSDPERQEVTTVVDVYGLGALLYLALAGVPPQRTPSGELRPPSQAAPERDLPTALDAVVAEAMAELPEERYPSVAALQEELEAFLSGELPDAEGRTPVHVMASFLRAHWAVIVTAIWSGIALGLISSLGLVRAQTERGRAEAALAQFHVLDDLEAISTVLEQSQALWPPIPERRPDFHAWLAQAEEVAARKGIRHAVLATQAHTRRHRLVLNVAWLDERTKELGRALTSLSHPETGEIASVRNRLDRADAIAIRDDGEAWAVALAKAQEMGVKLTPIVGLVPIGTHEPSGWLEFADLLSTGTPKGGVRYLLAPPEEDLPPALLSSQPIPDHVWNSVMSETKDGDPVVGVTHRQAQLLADRLGASLPASWMWTESRIEALDGEVLTWASDGSTLLPARMIGATPIGVRLSMELPDT